MASATWVTRYTPEQYLAIERKADFKSEYDGGFITGMAGTTRKRNLISGNLFSEIRAQLKGRRCEVYIGDARLCVSPTGLYTYPDVSLREIYDKVELAANRDNEQTLP